MSSPDVDPSGWRVSDVAAIEGKRFDVCIVGSGMTGCLAAAHFLKHGQRVVMIERGTDIYRPRSRDEYWYEDWAFDEQDQRICRNTWPGAEEHFDDLAAIENESPEFGFFYNMKYGLGGSGAVWSGISLRMMPDDFITRSRFGYGTNWPVDYDELAPFYDSAEQLLEVSGPSDRPGWPWKNRYRYPAFKQSYLDHYLTELMGWRLSPVPFAVKNDPAAGGCVGARNCVQSCPVNAVFRPHWRLLYPSRQDANLTLLLGAPCVRVNVDARRAVENVEIVSGGRVTKVHAKLFYLAANAVENTRLLLASTDAAGRTLANGSGKLGRGFVSHGAVVASIVSRDEVYPGRGRPTTSTLLDGLDHSMRAKVNAHRLEVWNGDFDLRFNPWDALSRIRLRKRLWGKKLVEAAQESRRRFSLTYNFELEVSDRNRLTLSSKRDKFGLPLALVDFRLGERDRRTYELLRGEAQKLADGGKFEKVDLFGFGLNGNHPLGTYRSGLDPATSVVDSYLRTHEHPNLYLLGGGVFNSTSAVNPSLTIVALTQRSLGDSRLGY